MTSLKPHGNNQIALLCTIKTTSPNAKQKVIELLSQGRSYYTTKKAQCTTWSYFTPSSRQKAPSQLISRDRHDTVVCGMEIYTAKQALTTQQKESWFRNFQTQVQKEGLYDAEGEELVVWYPTAGFVARIDNAAPYGGVVMLAMFTCKDGKRDNVVQVLEKYTKYVLDNEPDVLTYCTLTRPKAPNQILLFERYRDHKALAAHGSTSDFKNMFKGIAANIEVKKTILQEFKELENAFVSNEIGGDHSLSGASVASKL